MESIEIIVRDYPRFDRKFIIGTKIEEKLRKKKEKLIRQVLLQVTNVGRAVSKCYVTERWTDVTQCV